MALAHYPIDVQQRVFLQHNSGVTFFIESKQPRKRFLLKVHTAAGTGTSPLPEHARARLLWLEDLHATTGMTVQVPVRNSHGDVVTMVSDSERPSPYLCTMQQWVEGELPGRHFTAQDVFGIGQMMAQLHTHSSLWVSPSDPSIIMPDAEVKDTARATFAQGFQTTVDPGMLTPEEFETILIAERIISKTMMELHKGQQTWGPIHGDLNHSNLIFYGNEIRPIDFDSMCAAPYINDLGVTLYHILYQEPAIRVALLDGYQSTRTIPDQQALWLEMVVTWAAMNNLAFQFTIPGQRNAPILIRNLRQLANDFCMKLIGGQVFVLG